jgi:hypothetical protein
VVEYNYIYDVDQDAIGFASCESCIIRHNECENSRSENAAIYVYGSEYTEITRNLVYNIPNNDGIKLGSKDGADASKHGGLIKRNVIHDTAQDGISVYTSYVIVKENEIYNSASENGAIHVAFGVSHISIRHNNVHDNTLDTGKFVDAAGILIRDTVDADTVVVNWNNIFGNTPNGVTNKATDTLNAQFNWWGAADGPSGAGAGSGDAVSTNVDFSNWKGSLWNLGGVTIVYDDVTLASSGQVDSGNFDEIWDITSSDLTIEFTVVMNGMVDKFGMDWGTPLGAHAWSELGVREVGSPNFNPTFGTGGKGVWFTSDYESTAYTHDGTYS